VACSTAGVRRFKDQTALPGSVGDLDASPLTGAQPIVHRSLFQFRVKHSDKAVCAVARMVKELDLLEPNHGCGLNGLSRESIPKRT
jgi:hypothetical protein